MINKLYLTVVLSLIIIVNLSAQVVSELFLEGASVTTIIEEGENMWVGTYGQGIFMYSGKDDKWVSYSSRNSGLDNDLIYTLAASKDFVWVGTTEGLITFDRKKNQWRKRKFAQGGEFGNWIRSLYYDAKDNVLWIGRFRNVTRLDVARQRFADRDLTIANDPKTNTIKSIRADGDSVVWFGSEAGAHRYNKKLRFDDTKAWSFISNKRGGFNGDGDAVSISGFAFDPMNIWFATDEFVTPQQPEFNVGGVYRFDRRLRWDRFARAQGLNGNGIYCVERTGNFIWAGLYSFDRKEKKEYGKGLALINRINGSVYDVDLNSIKTKSSSIQAMHFDGKYMWLGTSAGLVRVLVDNPLAKWTLKKEPVKQQPPTQRTRQQQRR